MVVDAREDSIGPRMTWGTCARSHSTVGAPETHQQPATRSHDDGGRGRRRRAWRDGEHASSQGREFFESDQILLQAV